MSQNLFAARFGFPLGTLKHWEAGRREPSGASLTLLNVIAHNPRAVLAALRRPPNLRPIEEYTALWDLRKSRSETLHAAGLEELQPHAADQCPWHRCPLRPAPSDEPR